MSQPIRTPRRPGNRCTPQDVERALDVRVSSLTGQWMYIHASGMSDAPIGWIREIVLNARDPLALAIFWARIVGGTPTEWYDGWVTLDPPPHGQRLSFQRSEEARTATTVHVDVLVEELSVAHEGVIAAGASYVAER